LKTLQKVSFWVKEQSIHHLCYQYSEEASNYTSAAKQPSDTKLPLVHNKVMASREAVYVDDIPAPENCLYGAYVHSKKALALINKVDVKQALESPSVVSYISSTDIPKQGRNLGVEAFFGGEILFAEDTVEWVGQPIGLMVAKTWHDAKRAADIVNVDYDCKTLGPPILSVEMASEKKSFFEVPEWWAPKPVGDFTKGMSKADHRIESAEVRIGSQYYFYLETQTALAIPDEDECMVVYSSSQNPNILQTCIAKCLGIPIHNVRVITRRVGGAFGGKATRSVPIKQPHRRKEAGQKRRGNGSLTQKEKVNSSKGIQGIVICQQTRAHTPQAPRASWMKGKWLQCSPPNTAQQIPEAKAQQRVKEVEREVYTLQLHPHEASGT
ncbi:hypothetical protein KI387_018427, partial [Taxus chinensis]